MLGPIALALICCSFSPINLQDREVPKVPGEKFRLRLLGLPLVRFIGCKPEIVTQKKLDAEWRRYISQLAADQALKEKLVPSSPQPLYEKSKDGLPTIVMPEKS